jgi:hypothetical protein
MAKLANNAKQAQQGHKQLKIDLHGEPTNLIELIFNYLSIG